MEKSKQLFEIMVKDSEHIVDNLKHMAFNEYERQAMIKSSLVIKLEYILSDLEIHYPDAFEMVKRKAENIFSKQDTHPSEQIFG